jgi:hypothetical protein
VQSAVLGRSETTVTSRVTLVRMEGNATQNETGVTVAPAGQASYAVNVVHRSKQHSLLHYIYFNP